MSGANATVTFEDGHIAFTVYDGYRIHTKLYESHDAAWLDRSEDRAYEGSCTCGAESEPVVVHNTYGNGQEWDSTACRTCGVVTGFKSMDEVREAEARAERTARNWWGFGLY